LAVVKPIDEVNSRILIGVMVGNENFPPNSGIRPFVQKNHQPPKQTQDTLSLTDNRERHFEAMVSGAAVSQRKLFLVARKAQTLPLCHPSQKGAGVAANPSIVSMGRFFPRCGVNALISLTKLRFW
jgi:hypothetical protein